MKPLLENWRKYLKEEIIDFPSEATAAERYESYKAHMNAAIEQITSLEEIFERQGSTTEDLVKIRDFLEQLRDDDQLRYDIEGHQ
jgi:hypothetical protein